MIAVLCGGVGAARFLRALAQVVPPAETVAVVNTADDVELHGLAISPDLDTVTYTVAGAIDPDRGWGLRGETWGAMDGLGRYAAVRPDHSHAATVWFNLGDHDLATHLYRTARLREGATLTAVTAEVCQAWGVAQRLLPMTDDRVATRVVLDEATAAGDAGTEVSFQEYFVRLRHAVPVRAVRFDGAAKARPSPHALQAMHDAEIVVIAPSNPLVSIAPIRALAGVDDLLAARRDSVVAVSPIVGGAALKGPADRMLAELGHEPSVRGVASLYAHVAATLVIDPVDAGSVAAVEAEGMSALVTPSVMSTAEVGAQLARATLAAGRGAGRR